MDEIIYSNVLLHSKNLPVDIVLTLYEEQVKQEFDLDFIKNDNYLCHCREMHLIALEIVRFYFDKYEEKVALKMLSKHSNEEVRCISKSIKQGNYERLAL
jgi:sulfur relay (sulfurtransferase) DsrC/TusE family protein